MPKGQVSELDWPYPEGWARMRLQSVIEEVRTFVYKERHAAVQRGDAKAGDEGSFKSWKWLLTFVGGDDQGRSIKVDTQPRISSQEGDLAKKMYEALLGRELELGEDFDTDLVEGREADVLVANDVDGEKRSGKRFSTIIDAVSVNSPTPDDMTPPF